MSIGEIDQEIVDFATQEFATVAREKRVPGIAFGLIFNGQLRFCAGVGETELGNSTLPTADSIFRIASMTKSFTADAILLLRDRGALRLEDLVCQYLPWCSTMGNAQISQTLTIKDLLTMGGGFPTDDPWGDRQEDMPLTDFDSLVADGITFNRLPDTGFEYSNLGYALLGRLISVITGEEFEGFMKREILDRCGLTASTYFTDAVPKDLRVSGYALFDSELTLEPTTKNGAFTPMGGLHSSVNELTKWVAEFQSGKPQAQVPRRFVRSESAPAHNLIPARLLTSHYGYGLFIEDDAELGRFTSHSGGYPGFGSHMRWHRESGWAIVALGNLTYAPMSASSAKVMNFIANFYNNKSIISPQIHAATKLAMEVVTSMLQSWSEELADLHFSMNMDLDYPRAQRRSQIAGLVDRSGPFTAIEGSLISSAPSHAKWRLQGRDCEVVVEILMNPERAPLIQKLTVSEAIN